MHNLFYNSFCYNINLFLSYIYTRLCFKNLRIIRLPIYIRGKHKILFGKNFTCGRFNRLDAFGKKAKIRFGNNVQINDFNHIAALSEITIGDNCLIASNVFISDHNHGIFSDPSVGNILSTNKFKYKKNSEHTHPSGCYSSSDLSIKPIIIGKNVWIGESVIILPGVKVGDNSVIGAGSVVTKDIDRETIYAGNPAKKLKYFDHERKKWSKV